MLKKLVGVYAQAMPRGKRERGGGALPSATSNMRQTCKLRESLLLQGIEFRLASWENVAPN